MAFEPDNPQLSLPKKLRFVEALSRQERNAISWVPLSSLEAAIKRRRLRVLAENGDPVGFVLFGERRGTVRLHQVVVRRDARRIENATFLLRDCLAVLGDRPLSWMTCRVAEDLEAHLFWQALGFEVIGLTTHSPLHTRQLIVYARSLPWRPLQTLGSLACYDGLVPGSQATLDRGHCTLRDAENASRLLERRQLVRLPQAKLVSGLDSAWRSNAFETCRSLNSLSGIASVASSDSSQVESTCGSTSPCASMPTIGRPPSLQLQQP